MRPPSFSADAIRLVTRCLAAGEIRGPLKAQVSNYLVLRFEGNTQICSFLKTAVHNQFFRTFDELRKPLFGIPDDNR